MALKVNKHLLKKYPQYNFKNRDYKVKLTHVLKTDNGLCFNAEILSGKHKGKSTTAHKKDLILISYKG